KIGQNARRFIENNYAMDIIVKKELAVLQSTILKNNPKNHRISLHIITLALLARIKARFKQCVSLPVWVLKNIVKPIKRAIVRTANLIYKAMMIILRKYPEKSNALIRKLIESQIQHLPPKEALIFLLNLDTWLYSWEGRKSVEFGNGLHTKHRHINYYRFFREHIQDGQSVLDIGCGNGALTYNIAKKTSGRVIGIDYSDHNLQIARREDHAPNIDYIHGDIYELLPKEHFDVVVLSNVLEHLLDRVGILQQIIKTNTPKIILLRVPLFERDWRVPLKKELGLEWRLDLTHEIEYTKESFEAELEEAGLSITYQETRWGEIWAEVCSQ
ncbi:MAG: class I SAM-dependent methyltransferase, partial [Desulfobacterales bacterium]|nr:class I SAM-dependent methyltransferase [Desulfobacterales bacterium]